MSTDWKVGQVLTWDDTQGYWVYVLIDGDAKIKYVGTAANPRSRFEGHVKARNPNRVVRGRKTKYQEWIRSLDVDPRMVLIDGPHEWEETARRFEQGWIHALSLVGCELVNTLIWDTGGAPILSDRVSECVRTCAEQGLALGRDSVRLSS